MQGTDDSIFAIGDCTATSYAPTAQVASQQGAYLARVFKQMARKDNLQAKLSELQEKAAQPDVDGEEKKKVEGEVDGVMKQLEKLKLTPFHYSHQGSLALVSFSWEDMDSGGKMLINYFFTGISAQIRPSRTFRS
jgi:NADH:ubiquinone reductase (non-electrogenic)